MKSETDSAPRVSVGLPVYNGANYVTAAIESILAQTYTDFELIICDNASTDTTAEICRRYAATDPRVRYYRNDTNVGAAGNFNRAFELARGEYFKWAAHDDVLAPEFLAKCVELLDKNPAAVLACTQVALIDEAGRGVETHRGFRPNVGSPRPENRFGDLAFGRQLCHEVFGVMRSRVLKRTPLIGAYITSDRNLLAELSLLGPFAEVSEPLLMIRRHKTRSVSKPRHDRLEWFDTKKTGKLVFPYWREGYEYYRSIQRVPLVWATRVACWKKMIRWLARYWRFLGGDLKIAGLRTLNQLGWRTGAAPEARPQTNEAKPQR